MTVENNVSFGPSFSIINPNKDIKINFAAIPLVMSLLRFVMFLFGKLEDTSSKLKKILCRTWSRRLRKNVSSQHISRSVAKTVQMLLQALNVMSILNSNISSTIADGALFKEEVEETLWCLMVISMDAFYQGRMK